MSFENENRLNQDIDREEIAKERHRKAKERQRLMYGGASPEETENKTDSKKPVYDVMTKEEYPDLPDIQYVDMDLIDEYPGNEDTFNFDKLPEIMERIAENGYDPGAPISLAKMANGRYIIIAGHTRYKAMQMLGRDKIPAVVKDYHGDEIKMAEDMILDNFYRRTNKPLDHAHAIDSYIKNVLEKKNYKGHKVKKVAEVFHISESSVKRYQNLLKLPSELQCLADDTRVPHNALGEAIQLDETRQKKLIAKINNDLKDDTEHELQISSGALSALIKSLKKEQEREAQIAEMKTKIVSTVHDKEDGKEINDIINEPQSLIKRRTGIRSQEKEKQFSSIMLQAEEDAMTDVSAPLQNYDKIVLKNMIDNLKTMQKNIGEIQNDPTMITDVQTIKELCDDILSEADNS